MAAVIVSQRAHAGRMTGEGTGATFATAIAFQGGSKLAAELNGILVLVEHTTDDAGNVRSVLYEWKA